MTTLATAITFRALGTTASILVTDPAALESASEVLHCEVDVMDLACSRFRPDSGLAKLNASAGQAVRVSPLLFEAVGVALRAARVTNGRVDPTVGKAMRVIGYDQDFARIAMSGPEVNFAVGPVPGWRGIKIDARSSTVEVPLGVELDLGATAKALCADRAAAAAASRCGAGVLVSLGGDIAVAGPAPSDGWVVRVTHDHAGPPDAPGQSVVIRSGGLATSSTSVRRWARGGHALHHLVDPSTGRPAQEVWRTVTVAASSCVDANIASTAGIIVGAAAPAWLAGRRMPARLVDPAGAVTAVAGWPLEAEVVAACL